ncbi:MAG: hypothetical protein ACRYE9_05075, partial [Janthinobacterium lividum]
FDIRGIQHSFSLIDEWEGLCSNDISNYQGEMFDMFAFRNAEFPQNLNEDWKTYWEEIVPRDQKTYKIDSDLIPVYLCFGGLALYKRDYIKGCSYDSIEVDCEHISFHACLREKIRGECL